MMEEVYLEGIGRVLYKYWHSVSFEGYRIRFPEETVLVEKELPNLVIADIDSYEMLVVLKESSENLTTKELIEEASWAIK